MRRSLRESLETFNARFAQDLGADSRALGIRYDLSPRPGKAPIAYADAMRIGRIQDGTWRPAIARVSATTRSRRPLHAQRTRHETGHAVHIAAIRYAPGVLLAGHAVHGPLPDVPSWSGIEAGVAAEIPWALGVARRCLRAAVRARDARRAGLFEMRMLREPASDPNVVWTDITQTHLGIGHIPSCSWCARSRGNPGYMLNYAAGAILTADLRARTREAIGAFDAGNPRWYGWLSENLLSMAPRSTASIKSAAAVSPAPRVASCIDRRNRVDRPGDWRHVRSNCLSGG